MGPSAEWLLIFGMLSVISITTSRGAPSDKIESLMKLINHEEQPLVGLALDEQREPPLFYDTFFPVVYEMDLPSWTAKDLRLDMPPGNLSQYFACNDTYNSTDLWASTLCPIMSSLNSILDSFASEMKVFETFNASETKLDSQFSSCHEVKPHFSNHIIDEIEIELYLIQVILDCPMADVIHHKISVLPPNRTKYTDILKLFMDTHIAPRFRIVGYSKYAISTNTLLSLHTTELLDYLLDSFSWTTSINTCNSQRIPRLIITQNELRGTLQEIEERVSKKGLKLAIPISDISNYYKLQLADCVTTTAKSYIVRILVPLKKAEVTYKLIKINPIPFLNKDYESSRTMICQQRIPEGSLVVNTQTMRPVARAACEEAQLCRVPQEGDRPVISKCVTSALLNDTRGMLENCHMGCTTYEPKYLPYIKRIRSDQFVIVGSSSEPVNVTCKRDMKPVSVVGVPTTLGSLVITVPCSCFLSHLSEKYEINGPCGYQLEMKPVRPLGWSYDILLEHFHHRFNNNNNVDPNTTFTINNDTKIPLADLPLGPDAEVGDEDFNEVVFMTPPAEYSKWPIVLAYVFLLIGAIGLTAGFFVLRNVYVRIGQLEVSSALGSGTPSAPSIVEPAYSRNAQVAYTARAPSFAVDSFGQHL